MTTRITNQVDTLKRNVVIVPVIFYPHALAAPIFDATNPYISSIVRDGYGTYTVTLKDTYSSLLGFNVSYSDAGATEHVLKLMSPVTSLASFSTVTVHIAGNDGGDTDPDYEDDGLAISVVLVATK